ncbi:hypothetical protein, partial [uncultured Rikenella sp.]
CALKFFRFLLFTTDAASERNANAVCELPSGEEEGITKKNSTLQRAAQLNQRILQSRMFRK